MEKLYIHRIGTVIAIGIESDSRQEIEQRFYSLWNFGATTGELIWGTDSFAYCWTTPENLEKYFITSSLHKILNEQPNKFKGRKSGAIEHARQLAKLRYDEMIPSRFVTCHEFLDSSIYTLTQVEELESVGVLDLDRHIDKTVFCANLNTAGEVDNPAYIGA